MNVTRFFDIDDSRFKGMKDAELLSLIANQDHDALAFVMRNYYSFVYSVLFGHGWNGADSEEMTQDVFVNLSRNAARIIERQPAWKLGSMLGFMAKRAGSRRAEFNRKQKRDGITISADSPIEDPPGKQPRYTFRDNRPLQDSALLVQELISLIPEQSRAYVEDYIIEDATGAEINEKNADKSLTHIYKTIKEALERTRERLSRRPPPPMKLSSAPPPDYGFIKPAKIRPGAASTALTSRIVEMREGGMRFKEISNILGLSIRNVTSRFYQSKAYAACVAADQAIGDGIPLNEKLYNAATKLNDTLGRIKNKSTSMLKGQKEGKTDVA